MENIEIGNGAFMPAPDLDLAWICRYGGDAALINERYRIASILEAYNYLVTQCSGNEVSFRVRKMRKTLGIKLGGAYRKGGRLSSNI